MGGDTEPFEGNGLLEGEQIELLIEQEMIKHDFNTIKLFTSLNTFDVELISNAINRSAEAIRMLITDAAMLSEAAVQGKLATRADDSKHEGDYRRIIKGVNDTLDAVIGPLNVAAEYVDRWP